MAEIRHIGEVIKSSPFPEDSEPLTDYLNREIVILDYQLTDTGFGPAAVITAEVDGEAKLLTTFSAVVIRQLEEAAPHFPVKATPHKVKQYYTLV